MTFKQSTDKYCFLYSWSALTIGLTLGISLTYCILRETMIEKLKSPDPISEAEIRKTLFANIQSNRVEELLEKIFKNFKRMEKGVDEGVDQNQLFVYKQWLEQGLTTSFANYTVFLSLLAEDKQNSVIRFNENGRVLYNSSKDKSEKILNYMTYSPSTERPLKGVPVYVKYGRVEDFKRLSKINISVTGHIVIARHSSIDPANIVKLAEERGAIAVLLYTDPYDYLNWETEDLGINSEYVRGGSVLQLADNEQDQAIYSTLNVGLNIPKIPVLSISYGEAEHLLIGMKSQSVTPSEWKGRLNISYGVGPGYEDNSYLILEVNTILKQKVIHNVIGVIEGCTEPDRYVIVGNGGDPVRGTAALLLLSQAISNTMQMKKWCPRRSIVFCSWDALQFGSIASTQWLKENQNLLEREAIAYLNVDIEVKGNYTFMSDSVPILYKTIISATNDVKNPNKKESEKHKLNTIYKAYKNHRESEFFQDPQIGMSFMKSPFFQTAGIPVVQIYYDCDKEEQILCNPSIDQLFNPMDDNFELRKSLLHIWVEILRLLSDTTLLPMSESLEYYFSYLFYGLNNLKTTYKQILNKFNIELDHLYSDFLQLLNDLDYFRNIIKHLNEQDDLKVRKVNDILMRLEQTFINERGLPFRKYWKHVLYSPDYHNSNEGKVFSGLNYLLEKCNEESDPTKQTKLIEEFKKHISIIRFHFNSAKHLLRQTFSQ